MDEVDFPMLDDEESGIAGDLADLANPAAVEADDDVMSEAFLERIIELVSGSGGVQAHCAVRSCPFSEYFWDIPQHVRFPDPNKDRELANDWAMLCQVDVSPDQGLIRTDHLRVCSFHFEPRAFFDPNYFARRNYKKLPLKKVRNAINR